MKIEKHTAGIQAGRTYFLELVSVDGRNVFTIDPVGRIKLPEATVGELYSVVQTRPSFERCKDCAHATPDGPRNVTCQYKPSVFWSKMSKACNHFTPSQS